MLLRLSATKILQEMTFSTANIKIRCGTRIEAILGEGQVQAAELADLRTGIRNTLETDGVLVRIGFEPNTA